jgi:mono/diheme cytochrome c family protein
MLAAVVLGALVGGCDRTPDRFAVNVLFARNQKLATNVDEFATPQLQQRLEDIESAVSRYFGTPPEPRVPEVEGLDLSRLFDTPQLQLAAAASASSEGATRSGLYHQLCARCHAAEGSGQGPAARQLNPYPRDYRRGLFKFKTTPTTLPPTDEDLHRVLRRGIPGTAMPAFDRLAEPQREALVQYVKYLSIRGQFERALITEIALELDADDRLLDPRAKELQPTLYDRQVKMLEALLAEVVEPWQETRGYQPVVPAPPDDYGTPRSIARGRDLFFTTLTNCGKCHGDTALGDGQTDDYDEWTKELEPAVPAALADYLALGALPPRNSQPRSLREGIFRGGDRPADLFLRIKQGIAGTTMPNVAAQLRDEDIWHLVAHALYLPQDPLSRPGVE